MKIILILLFSVLACKAADLNLNYESSSLVGGNNDFFDSYSTMRTGVEVLFPISKIIRFSIGSGIEQITYSYFHGISFLDQVVVSNGEIVGAYGHSEYTRIKEQLNGKYIRFQIGIKL